MTQDLAEVAAPWIGVVLLLLGAAVGVGVLVARSLFAVCVGMAALAAIMAAALAALGHGDGALSLGLFGAGVAPVLLMAGVLLSGRAAKPRKQAWPWMSALAATLTAAVIVVFASEFSVAPRAIAAPNSIGLWLALLVFAPIAGCAALLGYGERGVLRRSRPDSDE